MVLDFGIIGSKDKTIQTADYRTAGSHQAENLNYEFVTDADVYEEIMTVPADKTYYISAIIISVGANSTARIATGAAASESDFLVIELAASTPFSIAFPTPIKIPSGTRLTVRTHTNEDSHFTLVGWEE